MKVARALILPFALVMLGACAGSPEPAEPTDSAPHPADTTDATPTDVPDADAEPLPAAGVAVVVTAEGPLPALRIVAAIDGVVTAVSCDGAGAGEGLIACTDSGAHIAAQPASLALTIKARGHHTEALAPTLTWQGEHATVTVALRPLDPFGVTADYRTGFAPDGLGAFLDMAVQAPTELGPVHVVKFYIDQLDGEPRVWFQDTRRHPLHHPFVQTVLGKPLSIAEFEAETYVGADRVAMAGSLLLHSATVQAASGPLEEPLLMTFFPSDHLTPEQALRAHGLVEERLGFAALGPGPRRLAYLPAGALQQADALAAADLFAARDALVLTSEELWGSSTLQLLNEGIAYGTLRVMAPEDLATTVVSFTDVLVLTRLPNSLPIVGGTITEERQTPLAHVNVAARARGTPNMALEQASQHPLVAPLIGELVRLEVRADGWELRAATLDEATTFWTERQQKEPLVPAFDVEPSGILPFSAIGFGDAASVGAKAANLAELRHLLGAGAPDGFAVPFHHHDAFMNAAKVSGPLCMGAQIDCEQEGRSEAACAGARALCDAAKGSTLLDWLAALLADPDFVSDTPLRDAALDGLRFHIGHVGVDAEFAEALDAAVLALGPGKVRLRSSTNAEDLPTFSGAGLYESVSATASGDEAASRRIRKVWASAYGFAAFEERTFWNINQLAVRMGVAVHPAYPDEAANGVLISQNIADPTVAGMYVNVQLGEVSVTNPEEGSLPEIFSIVPAPQGVQVVRQRYSSLSPDAPILSDSEVKALFLAAKKVQSHFAPLYGESPYAMALDMEFKLHGPERALIIKQVRPYYDPN